MKNFILICFCFFFINSNAQNNENAKAFEVGTLVKIGPHNLKYNITFDFLKTLKNNNEQVFRLQTGYWLKKIQETETIGGGQVLEENFLESSFDAGVSYLFLKKYFGNDKVEFKIGGIGTSLFHFNRLSSEVLQRFSTDVTSVTLKTGVVSNNRLKLGEAFFIDVELGYFITSSSFSRTITQNPILSVIPEPVSSFDFNVFDKNQAFIKLGFGKYF